jgi:dolichol kinase
MAFSSFIIIRPKDETEQPSAFTHTASFLTALLIAIYAAQKSRNQLRKLKRKLVFSYLKENLHRKFNKITSLFSKKKAPASDTTLLYILLALLVIILIFVDPIVAIAVLLLGILVILLTHHGFSSKI